MSFYQLLRIVARCELLRSSLRFTFAPFILQHLLSFAVFYHHSPRYAIVARFFFNDCVRVTRQGHAHAKWILKCFTFMCNRIDDSLLFVRVAFVISEGIAVNWGLCCFTVHTHPSVYYSILLCVFERLNPRCRSTSHSVALQLLRLLVEKYDTLETGWS